MSLGEVVQLFNTAILQVLLLSAPVLIVSIVVGLVVSILQATTSIQDQTLSFVPKIAAIMFVLIFFGSWMFTVLSNYTILLFQRMPDMVR
jgi:flagellar biosynthetic protein FliQ